VTTVGVVTARSGSKGIPDKNLQVLGSHPLLAWAVRAGLASEQIDFVVTSSDSESYLSVAREWGSQLQILRPPELASDESSDADVLQHVRSFLGSRGISAACIVHLRPTSPARDPRVVDEALLTFFGWMSEGVTAARSIQAMPESAYKSFELGANNELRPLGGLLSVEDANGPRQNFPVTYVANGYFDLFDVGSMNRQAETLYGGLVRAIATEPIVEVDSQFDLELLRAQVDAHPALEERLFGAFE